MMVSPMRRPCPLQALLQAREGLLCAAQIAGLQGALQRLQGLADGARLRRSRARSRAGPDDLRDAGQVLFQRGKGALRAAQASGLQCIGE